MLTPSEAHAIEERAWSYVDLILGDLILLVESNPFLWDRGDGTGGAIAERLFRAAGDAGFAIPRDVWQPSTQVQMLAHRDGWACRYCQVELAGGPSAPLPTVDHIVARAKGGGESLDNKCLACRPCNSSKGTRSLDEWAGR